MSDVPPTQAASDVAVANDDCAGCGEHASSSAIDDLISERREQQRQLLARCGPCVCPQLAVKLAHRLEKSESADSDVSETSFSLIAAAAPSIMPHSTPPRLPSPLPLAPLQPLQAPHSPPPQSPVSMPASSLHSPPPLPIAHSRQPQKQPFEPESTTVSPPGDVSNCPNGEVAWRRLRKKFNPFVEFPEFSRRDINRLKEAFLMYDADGDNFIGFNDLKLMMEKLGAPQTHLGLKTMIKEVDEDQDNRINFREFLTIFKKARAGQLDYSGELLAWYECYVEVTEIKVEEVGVMEAKNFFESKIAIQSAGGKLQAELLDERLRRQAEEEARRLSRASFRAKRAMFT